MDEAYYNKIMATIILIILIVVAFLAIRPILLSIIFGIILAFIFNPVYNLFLKATKSKNASAFLICLLVILLIVVPLWFLTPVLAEQAFKIYLGVQQIDFVTPLKSFFSSLFPSEALSTEIGSILQSFVNKMINSLLGSLSKVILNFPVILLQSVVVFSTLFFVLRDRESIISYIQSLLPFSKEIEKKLFESSKGITSSVIYGQIIIGLIQGIIAGLGFFIFGVPNALFYALLAVLLGVLPIVGTALVWVPIAVYVLITGDTFSALGILAFGLFSSTIDNFLRPIIVSKRTDIPSSIVLIGMVGGVFLFGVLGIILGPLVLAYLLIILELYRKKKIDIFST